MKKTIGILVLIAVAGIMGQSALAQTPTISFFFDDRNFDAGTIQEGGSTGNAIWDSPIDPWINELNAGIRGDGQQLYVSPVCTSGAHLNPSGYDHSLNELWLYMDVADRFAGDEVVSSVGIDLVVNNMLPYSHTLDTLTFTMLNPLSKWNQVVSGMTDARAVRVPVSDPGTGPVFDAALGYEPGGAYKIGRLDAKGAVIVDSYAPVGVYEVYMQVDSLLITRVYDGAGPTPEDVAFGYTGGLPEYAGPGNSTGTISAEPDAVIYVKGKGDYDLNGAVDFDDIGADASDPDRFLWNLFNDYSANVRQRWTGDFDGNGYCDFDDIGDPGIVGSGFMFSVFNWY